MHATWCVRMLATTKWCHVPPCCHAMHAPPCAQLLPCRHRASDCGPAAAAGDCGQSGAAAQVGWFSGADGGCLANADLGCMQLCSVALPQGSGAAFLHCPLPHPPRCSQHMGASSGEARRRRVQDHNTPSCSPEPIGACHCILPRSEYVVAISGEVRRRQDPNPKLKTGAIEITPSDIKARWLLALV